MWLILQTILLMSSSRLSKYFSAFSIVPHLARAISKLRGLITFSAGHLFIKPSNNLSIRTSFLGFLLMVCAQSVALSVTSCLVYPYPYDAIVLTCCTIFSSSSKLTIGARPVVTHSVSTLPVSLSSRKVCPGILSCNVAFL